jgi:N-acetylneuraminic acid mutarotase
MTYERQRLFAAAVNGRIIAGGGLVSEVGLGWDGSDTIEEYDPSANLWVLRSPMPDDRLQCMSAVVDGIVYVIGGYNWTATVKADSVYAYSMATDTWSTRTPMPSGLGEGACGVIDGEIHVVGGNNGYNEILPTHYIYSPSSDTWRKGAGMPKALSGHGAAVVGGVLYVLGGRDPLTNEVVNTVYAYRPK